MKQLTFFLIPLLAITLLFGCGSDTDSSSNETQQNTASTDGQTDPAETAGEAVALRYRFQKGQRMDYLQKTFSANNILSLNQKTETTIDIYCHITVDDVAPDGTASVTWTNDRAVYKVQGPGGTIRYDSADGEEPDHPQWEQGVKYQVLPMQHAGGTFNVSPRGTISNFNKIAELEAWIKENPDMAVLVTPSRLEAIAQELFLVLPEKAVKPNATWNTTSDFDIGTFNCSVATTRTYQGLETRSGKSVARVDSTQKITTELPAGGPIKKLQFKDGSTFGKEWFDSQLGWLTEKTETTVMEQEIETQGILMVVESATKATLQLQPPPGPAPTK
jgi:hypothetical protein